MVDWDSVSREDERQHRAAVLALPVLPLRRHGTVTATEDRDVLLSVSVGPAGEAVALWSAPSDRSAFRSVTRQLGWAVFPDARAARPAAARITVQATDPTGAMRVSAMMRIAEMPLAHAAVQPLPGGRFLVVGARCRWRPEGPDRNAIVYGADGKVVGLHTFGDGIAHVLTTPSGQAWVGYFDEGVTGNYGWDSPGPEPLGACGLTRFGYGGQPDWRFPAGDAPSIDDCYALNVTGETAWTCYWSDFPLVRVHDGQLTIWRNDLAGGAQGLIVDEHRVALVSGYRPHRDRLVVGELGAEALHDAGRYRLVLPDGEPLPADVQIVGRGPDLHIFQDSHWYRLGLDDIPLGQ